MTSVDVFFEVYWAVVASSIVLMLVLRFAMTRALRRAGAHWTTGLFTSTLYAEMRAYKTLCQERGASLRWWRLWWVLHIATGVLIVGWWILLPILR